MEYNNAVNISAFLWASKMITDFMNHLEATQTDDVDKLSSLTKWNPKLIRLIQKCNSHSDYIKEPISGHPYENKTTPGLDYVEDGELKRPLYSYSTGHRTRDETGSIRGVLLSNLSGLKQNTIKRNTDPISMLDEMDDSEW